MLWIRKAAVLMIRMTLLLLNLVTGDEGVRMNRTRR